MNTIKHVFIIFRKNIFLSLQFICVISTFCWIVYLAYRIYLFPYQNTLYNYWWIMPLAICISFIAADFISGVVHWIGDSFGSEKTPFIGNHVIQPFRDHHGNPTSICEHGFIQTNGNNCLILLIFMVPIYLSIQKQLSLWYILLLCFFLFFSLLVFVTNQIHKYAHMCVKKKPRSIAWLQQHHLIISPEKHNLHHQAPYNSNYCITCGWCNPVLEKIRFFRVCEKVIHFVFCCFKN